MIAALDDVLSGISQFLVLMSLVASAYFIGDYGIVRPLARATDAQGHRVPKFFPWWKSGIGIMFFALGLSTFLTNLVITLTLALGQDYPGRQFVRVALYLICTAAIVILSVVYAYEGSTKRSVLVRRHDQED